MPIILHKKKDGGGRRRSQYGISTPQIRVLLTLLNSHGPLSRSRISEKCGNKTPVVASRAIGYSDPVKREAFEQTKEGGGKPGQPCPSLLTLEYVVERELDIDGLKETVVQLTEKGRRIAESLVGVDLPEMRDTHNL